MKPAAVRLLLALACLLGPAVPAQIRLGLSVDPVTAMQFEPITARLTVLNNTGDLLTLNSNGNARLRYIIRDSHGLPVRRVVPDALAFHEVEIAPSLSAVLTNRLNNLYQLAQPGSYTVEVELEWGGLAFSPERRFVEVVPGITIQEMDAGIPGGQGTRRYMLKVLNRDRQDHLFLRVDDLASGLCYGVSDLGRHIRMEPPSMRVDGSGYLHVLHQSGPYEYSYSVFSPSGRLDRQAVHGGEYTIVRLKTLNDGSVEVNESAGARPPLRPPDSIIAPPAGRRDRATPKN